MNHFAAEGEGPGATLPFLASSSWQEARFCGLFTPWVPATSMTVATFRAVGMRLHRLPTRTTSKAMPLSSLKSTFVQAIAPPRPAPKGRWP